MGAFDNSITIVAIIFVVAFIAFVVHFFVGGAMKKSRSKNFSKKNPSASNLYIVAKNIGGRGEDVTIKKIDGKTPHTFTYFRLHGVHLLPGKHTFTLEYAILPPNEYKYKTQNISTVDFTIGANKRYLLEFGNAYSLIELPSLNQMDERTLVTYLDNKAEKGEEINANSIRKDFGK